MKEWKSFEKVDTNKEIIGYFWKNQKESDEIVSMTLAAGKLFKNYIAT